MNKYLITVILLCCSFIGFSQGFRLAGTSANITAPTDSTYAMTINFAPDQTGGSYLPTNVLGDGTMDVYFDIQGRGQVYTIIGVSNLTFSSADVVIVDRENYASGPTFECLVYTSLDTDLVPTTPSNSTGLSPKLFSSIQAYNNRLLNRFTIPTLSDTSTIVFPYLGLITWVIDIEQEWQYTGSWNQKVSGGTDDRVPDILTSLGVVAYADNMGGYPGTIVPDAGSVKDNITALEAALQAARDSINALRGDIGTGGVDGVVTAGAVSGSTLSLTRSIGADVDIDVSSLVGGGGSGSIAQPLHEVVNFRFDTLQDATTYNNKIVTDYLGDTYFVDSVGTIQRLRDEFSDNAVHVIFLPVGQSNAAGRAPNTSLTADQVDISTNIKIYDWRRDTFEWLDIGTNNMSTPSTDHGIEAGLQAHYNTYYPGRTLYLIKYAQGATSVTNWLPGAEDYAIQKAWFLDQGLRAIKREGKVPYVTGYIMQGESDAGTGIAATHQDSIKRAISLYREWLPEMPVILGKIKGDSIVTINQGLENVAAADKYVRVLQNYDYSDIGDGVHFSATAQDSMALFLIQNMTTIGNAGGTLMTYPVSTVPGYFFYDFEGETTETLFEKIQLWTDHLYDTVTIGGDNYLRIEGGNNQWHRTVKTVPVGQAVRFNEVPYTTKEIDVKFTLRFNAVDGSIAMCPFAEYRGDDFSSHWVQFISSSNTIRIRTYNDNVFTTDYVSSTATVLDIDTDYDFRITANPDSVILYRSTDSRATWTRLVSAAIPLSKYIGSGSLAMVSAIGGTVTSGSIDDVECTYKDVYIPNSFTGSDSDNQTLSYTEPDLSISGGNSVDLSSLLDSPWEVDGTNILYPNSKVTIGLNATGVGDFNFGRSTGEGSALAYFDSDDFTTFFIRSGLNSVDASSDAGIRFVGNNNTVTVSTGLDISAEKYKVDYGGTNLNGSAEIEVAVSAVTFNAVLDLNANRITDVGTPTATTDAATKAYADTKLSGITATATLDFGSTAANAIQDLTVTVTGAVSGGRVLVAPPPSGATGQGSYYGFVSAVNTVTVRFHNDGAGTYDPASGDFTVTVIQ